MEVMLLETPVSAAAQVSVLDQEASLYNLVQLMVAVESIGEEIEACACWLPNTTVRALSALEMRLCAELTNVCNFGVRFIRYRFMAFYKIIKFLEAFLRSVPWCQTPSVCAYVTGDLGLLKS